MAVENNRTILEVKKLRKHFGGVVAVGGASFAVREGTVVGLVGPNGAGKTTIFNLIDGSLQLDGGSVWFRGHAIGGSKPDQVARMGIGRTFQDVRVFEGMSALDNLLVYGMPLGSDSLASLLPRRGRIRSWRAARDHAVEALRFVGLNDVSGREVGSLSYGEQKLVALARVLALESDLLMLDEPVSGLHPREIAEMVQLLLELKEAGRTVLIIEHNLEVVRELADVVIFLVQGVVVKEDSPERVFADKQLAEIYMGTEI